MQRFAPSRTPYALALAAWTLDERGASGPAVWVKRARGHTVAVRGTLILAPYGFQLLREVPPLEEYLEREHDSRYGGDANSRLSADGSFWTFGRDWAEATGDRDFLQGVLDGLPEPPSGHDGWWTFK